MRESEIEQSKIFDSEMVIRPESWQQDYAVIKRTLHTDERGWFCEILRLKDHSLPTGGQIYSFSIEPGARRGDHYHRHKKEWFSCVYGQVTVLLTTADGKNIEIPVSANEPKVIFVGEGTRHAFINTSREVGIVLTYSSVQHDPSAPDTYFEIAYPDRRTLN